MPNWKALLLTTGIASLLSGPLSGQVPTFQKKYGAAGSDNGYHILETANGYLIACSVSPTGTNVTDACLLSLDAFGNILWQRTYGGAQNDRFTLVTEANDGGFLAMGETQSAGQGATDILLVKTDQNGNVEWSKTIGGNIDDTAPIYGRIVNLSDGYLISGLQKGFSGSMNDRSYFMRLDNAGNVVWQRRLTSPFGNYIVGTYIEGDIIYAGGGADGDACFATLDLSNGNILSARRYGGAYNETVYNICPASDGNLLLSDGTWSALNNTESRQLLIKTDKNGEVIWTKIYGKPGFSVRGFTTNAADGGFILAPFITPGSNQRDAYLAKTDADGNVQWSYDYSDGNPVADLFYHAVQTADGGIIAVGSTRNDNGFDDIFVVKTDADGLVANGCVEPFDLNVEDYSLPGASQDFAVSDFALPADWNVTAQNVSMPSANTCAITTPIEVVNDYTPVQGFFGCDSTLLQVGSVAGFAPGDEVLIIQMKGATVDLSNTPGFGNITDAGNAGNFEFNRIKDISGNQVQLLYKLTRPYDVAGKVQLIRVPEYDDFSTNGLTCKPWDGETGGVLVIDVANTLTLLGDLDVSGKGFRGGKVVDTDDASSHETGNFYPPDPALAAEKGEGIAIIPLNQSYGRGKSANGGGGGNAHNAGGGGGGNAGAGGNGGLEYYNTPGAPTPGTDGVGGLTIFGFDVQKITLGGGGGAGHTNDNVGTSGGNGGGIILVKAGTVNANGFRILANGEDVIADGTNRNDGQGGGGAGGTILFEASQVVDNLSFELKGGRGGDCLFFVNSQIIGPGGGGGGGKLALSQLFPTITLNLNGGANGIANQNMTNGAQPGQAGAVYFVPFPFGTFPLGADTVTLPSVHYNIGLCPGDTVVIDGIAYTQPATVTDTITGTAGCDTVATYTIHVINIPVLDLGPDIILCVDSTVVFDAGPAFVQYLWQDSSTAQTFAASEVGTYWVEVTDSCGNTQRDSVFFTVSLLPDTQFPDTVLCAGDSIYLTLPGFDTYIWAPAAGLSCTDCADVTLFPAVTTTYTLLATTSDGCVLTDTFVVDVLPLPTFTETITFCPGESVVLGGTTYTQPATVTLVLPSASGGCDTIATYVLEYATPAPSVVTIKCPSDIDIGISPGAGDVVVDYDLPVVSTDCPCPGTALELTEGLPSGSSFPPGLTLVCYEAKDSCGNTASCCFDVMIREEQPCDIKKNGCMKYELLSITKDATSKKTYRIRATNSCNNPLTYIAIQLPNSMTAKKPLNNTIYTAPSGREYLVRNPNYSPFYSIRFKSTTDSISNGESDIFEYTLPAQADPAFIHITARLEPQVYYEAHLNTFYCPVETTPDPNKTSAAPGLKLFPNPTSGDLFVDLSQWRGEQVQVQVFDSRGQRVTSLALTADAAPQPVLLPENLAGGLYFFEMQTESGEKQSLRFVLMR